MIGSLPDTQPPLDKIKLSPNHYENNLLLGGTCAYAPAQSGCKVEPIPAGWSVEQELAKWKPLTPEDVGPAWGRQGTSGGQTHKPSLGDLLKGVASQVP